MQVKFKEFFYLSNLLSLSRVILIIPFAYLIKLDTPASNIFLILLAVFLILSDVLDGYFSRKLNQVTDLGKVLDPIADKIGMAITFVALILYRDFPIPLFVFLLYRDLIILVISWIGLRRTGKPKAANIYGKLNTAVVSFTILFFLIGVKGISLQIFLAACYISIIISGISYEQLGEKIIFSKKSSRYWFRFSVIFLAIVIAYFMKGFSYF